MKRLILLVLVVLLAFGGVAMAKEAPVPEVSEPNVIVGTHTDNHRGLKITVGFSPCGHSYPWTDENGNPTTVHDPNAQYMAVGKKGGGWTTTVWAHSIGVLDSQVFSLFGERLSTDAVATLEEDAATYTCTG